MKKLKKMRLIQDAEVLDENEMKMIKGGYNTGEDGKCDTHSLKCDPEPCWIGDTLNRGYCRWAETPIGKFCACHDH